jgi:mono/diheme cytochrome c family protein
MKPSLLILTLFVLLSALTSPGDKELEKSIARGKEIYKDNCIACHMAKGEGIPETFPPLAGSDYFSDSTELAIRAIKFGLEGPIKVNGEVYDNQMPELGLAPEEIADVMNYILNSWGNDPKDGMVTKEMVEAIE